MAGEGVLGVELRREAEQTGRLRVLGALAGEDDPVPVHRRPHWRWHFFGECRSAPSYRPRHFPPGGGR